VLRYVERNPLRAGLVERAEDWRWSSLSQPPANPPSWLDPGPVPRGNGWVEEVNRIAANDDEVIHLQKCIERGTPFGSESWTNQAVAKLGLESSVRPRGRPRKIPAANLVLPAGPPGGQYLTGTSRPSHLSLSMPEPRNPSCPNP
jgi:putative transposase